jgi:hypothetical protein
MVVAYLMKLHAMSFEQALAFVVERRPMANPNESFRRQLQEYGRRLQRSVPKEKAARAARGPAGPQLPPAASAESEQPSASIGPQLLPHLTRAQKAEPEAVDASKGEEEKAVIGPSLPPHLKRQRVEPEGDAEGEPSTKKTKASS